MQRLFSFPTCFIFFFSCSTLALLTFHTVRTERHNSLLRLHLCFAHFVTFFSFFLFSFFFLFRHNSLLRLHRCFAKFSSFFLSFFLSSFCSDIILSCDCIFAPLYGKSYLPLAGRPKPWPKP